MKTLKLKTGLTILGLSVAALSVSATAQDTQRKADDLDSLLEMVRTQTLEDKSDLKRREAEFAKARDQQAALLAQAKAQRDAAEARSRELEAQFDANKQEITAREQELNNRLGSLKELFGIFQQTAGDLQGRFFASPISAQYKDRGKFLEAFAKKMSKASEISTVEEIERLWFELQREMTQSAKIVRFNAPVLGSDGKEEAKEVIRVGAFDVITNDPKPRYLIWRGETQSLAELLRQPDGDYLDMIEDFAESDEPVETLGVDPTGGSLLSRLVDQPGLFERIDQGGLVGYVIIAMGLIGLLLAGERLYTLSGVSNSVAQQKRSLGSPDTGNPLGRVLKTYHDNKGVDPETLEMKLGEALLVEVPKLNRGLTYLKIISVAAPLLGLLGTVTGMIVTFQAITLFGTGDPKTMAGGISQALVTTVQGLCVAIPIVFLYAITNNRAKAIIHTLQEQSAGLIAEYMERGQDKAAAPGRA